MENQDYIIELKNVRKKFDDATDYVVEEFNLKIKKGEFVTFLGPSGCGKTTTLRMIAGFDTPTEGQILLKGVDISSLPPYKRPINTVFQKYALFPTMNVYENIAFGLKMKKVPVTVTKNGKEVTKMVHLSKDVETAFKVGGRHGIPVVLVIDTLAMQKDGYKFYYSKNGVWLCDDIDFKYVKEIIKQK